MKPRRVKGLDPSLPLRENAARIVRSRLDEMRSLAEAALDPEAAEAQHDLRIAAKRLRYVLEIAGTCWGPQADTARKLARDLQDVLGEIHDCDVMLPQAAGIDSLTALLRTRRELLFRHFVDLWQAEKTKAAWGALEKSL